MISSIFGESLFYPNDWLNSCWKIRSPHEKPFWPSGHACPYVRKVVIIYYWVANNIDLISKKFHHFCVHWIPWYCILFLMTAAYWKSLWNIAVIDLNFRMSHGKTKTDWTSFTLLSWWYHCEKIAKIVVKTIWSANDWKCLVRRLMSVCLKTKIGRSILVTKRPAFIDLCWWESVFQQSSRSQLTSG